MATLPVSPIDPTLEAVDAASVSLAKTQPPRPYLGMSGIGHPCLRKHWYDFRWCSPSQWDAATLYRFDDGHRSEAIMAERLRRVEGIQLQTIDPKTGRQFGFADIGGHFRGHADGIITGLLQAPKTPHIWEHKCVNETKQRKLEKLIQELGEKQALEHWDSIYYVQAQLYMYYSGLKRHYLTCASPGTRRVISVRTNRETETARQVVGWAKSVVTAATPCVRINDDPSYHLCKWCPHTELCHGAQVAQVNCRTCAHATPELDGDGRWSCAFLKRDISAEIQREAGNPEHPCPHHRFIPDLIPFAKPVNGSQEGNWVEYRDNTGQTFRNGGDGGMTSLEIHELSRLGKLGRAAEDDAPFDPSPKSDAATAGTSSQTALATEPALESAE